jgi:hypothetical protein
MEGKCGNIVVKAEGERECVTVLLWAGSSCRKNISIFWKSMHDRTSFCVGRACFDLPLSVPSQFYNFLWSSWKIQLRVLHLVGLECGHVMAWWIGQDWILFNHSRFKGTCIYIITHNCLNYSTICNIWNGKCEISQQY